MLYGLLVFVFQYGSRRAANGQITRPMFEHNLRLLFPQLESLPHSDTLFRLLCRIDVGQIEQAHIELVNHRLNVHTRCNLGARYRWGIEGAFLVEKHQGFYESPVVKQWNVMKGYHYLMRLAHLLNTLARFFKDLAELFSTLGVQAAIGLIRNTLTGPWLDTQDIEQRLAQPFRLRLL